MRIASTPQAVIVALVVAGALWADPARSRKKAAAPCPTGRYLLAAPLLAGQGTPVGDAVATGAAAVAIDGLCPPIAPKKFKGTRKGTRVTATWPSCPGLTGRVRLTGTIVDGCASFQGTLKARRLKQGVSGKRSTCGDVVVDRGGGEECDPPAAGTCAPECRTSVTTTIGPGGGQVTSLDGRLALDVPAGALASDTAITVRRLAPEELPPRAAEVGLGLAYTLGPDGLQFAAPVTATVQLDGPPLQVDGSFAADAGFLFTVSAGGTAELLGAQRTRIDVASNTATASGTLTHFSMLYHFGSSGRLGASQGTDATGTRQTDQRGGLGAVLALTSVGLDPETMPFPVGKEFLATVTFGLRNSDLGRPSRVTHTDMTKAGTIEYLGATSKDDVEFLGREACGPDGLRIRDRGRQILLGTVTNRLADPTRPPNPDSFAQGFLCYRCREEGGAFLKAQITVEKPLIELAPDFPLGDFPFIDEVFISFSQEQLTTDIEIFVECEGPPTPTPSLPGTTSSTVTSTTAASSSTSTSTTSSTTTTSTSTTTTTLRPCVLDEEQTPPVCDGECPGTDRCLALPDATCACTPVANRCRDLDPGGGTVCGGLCESPSQRCGQLPVPEAPCTCITLDNPCGLDRGQSPPVCNGDCPPGQVCLDSALPGEACRCAVPSPSTTVTSTTSTTTSTTSTTTSTTSSSTTTTPATTTTTTSLPTGPCRSDGAGACGGDCPAGSACVANSIRTGGGCFCAPEAARCGLIPGFDVCGGFCDREDRECAPDDTGACVCTACRAITFEGRTICFGGCSSQPTICAALDGACACVPNDEFCQPRSGGPCSGRCLSPQETCVPDGPGCTCRLSAP